MTILTAPLPLPRYEPRGSNTEHPVKISLIGREEAQRHEVERFIRSVFCRAYSAKVTHFLPNLLSMRQNDKMLAALGICPANDASLFLERYLDKPIENRLAEKLCRPIDRSRVVEVGNLASIHGGSAQILIITLTAYLSGASYEWAVFTATPTVRNNFSKLGIELIPIAHADKSRLGEAQYNWGHYYEQGPTVVVGHIRQGASKLLQALKEEKLCPAAQQLWNDAFNMGCL